MCVHVLSRLLLLLSPNQRGIQPLAPPPLSYDTERGGTSRAGGEGRRGEALRSTVVCGSASLDLDSTVTRHTGLTLTPKWQDTDRYAAGRL